MKPIKYVLLGVLGWSINHVQGIEYQRLFWENIEVVYIEDNSFPTYSLSVLFDDGALSDAAGFEGETSMALGNMKEGTDRYQQKEIADILDFYAVSPSVEVTHEYSTYSFGGLVKDILPTTKFICHMFRHANFPVSNIRNVKSQSVERLKNLVVSPSQLANRVFRELSLQGSGLEKPSVGTTKSISNMKRQNLVNKINYFNNEVKKKVYLTGPKSVLEIKNVLLNECQWGMSGKISRKAKQDPKKIEAKFKGKMIFFVPMAEGNQSQIRIGRTLNKAEFELGDDQIAFSNAILGRSFTSILMQEIRVKRGLTYGIYSYVGSQASYGRSFISTSTDNNNVVTMLKEVKAILNGINKDLLEKKRVENTKRFLAGRHLFQFETSAGLLSKMMYYEHAGRKVEDILKFNDYIASMTPELVRSVYQKIFNWDQQVILVLGNKKLQKELEDAKIFPVIELNFKDYL
jgi:zinc protease